MIAAHIRKPYDEPPRSINGYDPLRDASGYEWSPKDARQLVECFPDLFVLTSGRDAGKPFQLQPWQADYLATLNGWRDQQGNRRYRESTFFTPRKNGKTETGAGLALFGLAMDREQRAQVYSAAKTREQASMVFEPAAVMAHRAPSLARRLEVTPSRKRIGYPATGSYYQALCSDAGAIHGTNPHFVLFDELHTQPHRELYDVLKSGMGARSQPLFVSMSTAGHDRTSICWEVWTHAQKVRDGLSDPTFLPLIYETPADADWTSEDVWRACNPNLDVIVPIQFLRDEFRKAKEIPAYENTFRNLYLNQWTQQEVRWLPMDKWDLCGGELEIEHLRGRRCWAGLDMSTTTDLTAFAMAFPLDNGAVAIVVKCWRPEDTTSEASKRDRVDYGEWSRRGHVTLTPGRVVDHDYVRRDINRLREIYDIQEIAADRWNASQLLTQLAGDGFQVVEHGQGFASMSAPSKEFERLVVGGNLIHFGDPVLRWMASNVAAEIDPAGNVKPTKAKSTGRIDGIVAAIMAVGRAVTSTPTGETFCVFG